MPGRKAFTLSDLLAVLVAGGVLSAVFLVATEALHAQAQANLCLRNMNAIGKGLAIYTAAYKDQFPWIVSSNKWDAATGENRALLPSEKVSRGVSALLFMLVRDGQSPSIFVCPGTSDEADPNVRTGAGSGTFWYWDFSPYKDGNREHVSYSYQAPLNGKKDWESGVSSKSDSALVIAADRTPTYDGQNANFDWAKPGNADPNTGMSQNHGGFGYINVLYADFHVVEANRADVGVKNDNIYSAAGMGKDGMSLATEQGPGSLKLADHLSVDDSFLLGPKKMEK